MEKITKMILVSIIVFFGIIFINTALIGEVSCNECFQYGPAFSVCQDWCQFYHEVDCFDVAPPTSCECLSNDDCYCTFWFYCEDEHYAKRSLTFSPSSSM